MRALIPGSLIVAAAASFARGDEAPPPVDPYTGQQPERLAAAGYVSVGRPLRLTRQQRSEAIEEVLGLEWMLWAETEHFRLGSALSARVPLRGDRAATARREAEWKALRDRGLDLPRKVAEIDPWLNLHLFALRLEAIYSEFEQWMGVTEQTFPAASGPTADATLDRTTLGPYLGAHGKFVVLLFENKADVARYAVRFAGAQHENSYRYLVPDEDVHVFVTAREPYSVSAHESSWFECHVVGSVVRLLTCAYRGYRYQLPLWWTEGLAHHATRRLDPTYFSPTVVEGQEADSRLDANWEDKVYARVKHQYYPTSAELLTKGDPREFAFADHLMAWSRVDFLFQRPGGQPGKYLCRMKSVSWHANLTIEDVCAVQEVALEEGFGLDYETLDEEWAAWVRKAYHPGRRKRAPR